MTGSEATATVSHVGVSHQNHNNKESQPTVTFNHSRNPLILPAAVPPPSRSNSLSSASFQGTDLGAGTALRRSLGHHPPAPPFLSQQGQQHLSFPGQQRKHNRLRASSIHLTTPLVRHGRTPNLNLFSSQALHSHPHPLHLSPDPTIPTTTPTSTPTSTPFLPSLTSDPYHPSRHSPPSNPTIEQALQTERARIRNLEKIESSSSLTTSDLRCALKKERLHSLKLTHDLATLKSQAIQSQAQAEVHEEWAINGLLRRLECLQAEKGRIIVELEREEEMLTNTLQKKLNEVRREKALLQKKIEMEHRGNTNLKSHLSALALADMDAVAAATTITTAESLKQNDASDSTFKNSVKASAETNATTADTTEN